MMITRDMLYKKLLYLVPNAKFSFWPDERTTEEDPIDGKGYEVVISMAGWVIRWCEDNPPFPGWDAVNAVTDKQANDKADSLRKIARDKEMAKNMAVVSNYQAFRLNNPTVSFSQYLDMLENLDLGLGS